VTIIGVLPEERIHEQPLVVGITMALSVEHAALTGDLSATVDYSQLSKTVAFILKKGRFRLLESAALALARFVLKTAPMVNKVSVHLSKPEALGGHGIPHISVIRFQADLAQWEDTQNHEVIFECPGTSLRIDNKSSLTTGDEIQSLATSKSAFESAEKFDLGDCRTLTILAHEV
jgi:dihydroneopterin aldolase